VAEVTTPKKTLGLTGLTSNAMALIAPGAFLWLTYAEQSTYGKPLAGCAMWLGIIFALLLCLATAVAYAELSKLYPGAGSSYFFAEQAFLSKKAAYKYARICKFVVGWASHLYYWVYPGLMVGVTAIVVGFMMGQVDQHFYDGSHFNPATPSPIFMYVFCVFFSFFVAWIAYRGVGGATGVNAAINVIQIVALLIFSVMAILHRTDILSKQKAGKLTPDYTVDSNDTLTSYVQPQVPDTTKTIPDPKDPKKTIQDPNATTAQLDASGNPVYAKNPDGSYQQLTTVYDPAGNPGIAPGEDPNDNTKMVSTFSWHDSAVSVIKPHGFNLVFIQAGVAILILVGFESVTSMGEEAKNAKRDIPRAVILALVIQGGFCYLLEYFAAQYFLSPSYTNTTASGQAAPLGDMMGIVGAYWFGSVKAGWWFMMVQAFTVFLALIGTTLSCMSTGARVTYAMGRDEEMGAHFGVLHGKNATPHRAIWTLAVLSAIIGIVAVVFNFCGPAAMQNSAVDALPHNFWYKIGVFHNELASKIPQSLLVVTLVSNFGTFLLYMMTCWVAVVAFREHHMFNGIKHMVIPIFGLLANLVCMVFYIVGPFSVPGMSFKEPLYALGVCALWGIWGAIYFLVGSKKTGKSVLISNPPTPATI
jgi:amino acid transporter